MKLENLAVAMCIASLGLPHHGEAPKLPSISTPRLRLAMKRSLPRRVMSGCLILERKSQQTRVASRRERERKGYHYRNRAGPNTTIGGLDRGWTKGDRDGDGIPNSRSCAPAIEPRLKPVNDEALERPWRPVHAITRPATAGLFVCRTCCGTLYTSSSARREPTGSEAAWQFSRLAVIRAARPSRYGSTMPCATSATRVRSR